MGFPPFNFLGKSRLTFGFSGVFPGFPARNKNIRRTRKRKETPGYADVLLIEIFEWEGIHMGEEYESLSSIIERVYTRKKEHGKHKNDPDLENAKKEYREIFFRFAR